MLQAGLDLGDDETVAFGPYVSLSFATFTEQSIIATCSGNAAVCGAVPNIDIEQDVNDDDRAVHQWLTIGFRGTFVIAE